MSQTKEENKLNKDLRPFPLASSTFADKFLFPLSSFLFPFFALLLVWQIPFTYKVELGQPGDDWAVVRGFGDRESNANFAFRWTTDREAELRLPDVGWPSRVGVIGLAPRPDNAKPAAFLSASDSRTEFKFGPEQASQPPDPFGRLTFETAGPSPRLALTANRLIIGNELYQPVGDPRSLGLVISEVYIRPQPVRLGLVVPPLAQWLGWSALVSLIYFGLGKLAAIQTGGAKRTRWPFLGAVLALAVVIGLRVVVPGWTAVNGAGVAWGLALPVTVWLLAGKWQTKALTGLPVLGVLLVFYGLALAPFALALFITTGIVLLIIAWKHDFTNHLENAGLLLCLTAGSAWGLWQGRLPRTDDISTYHLYWLNELDRLIRQGNLYPRWATDFSWQQGGAVFNYYSPLSRYLAEVFHLLGLSFNQAIMLTQFGAIVAGTLGCYFWSAEITGSKRAALLGGLAYCYYPFNLADIFVGGGLANTLAGSILPWLFWLITVVVKHNLKYGAIWLGLVGAAFALSNNPQLILFMPLAVLYLAGLLVIQARKGRLDWGWVGLKLGLAALLAFGLSAFFLLPAVLESGQVGLSKVGAAGANFYANLPENLALWRPIYPGLQNYGLLGTLHFVVAAIGLVIMLFYRHPNRPYLWLLTGLLALTLFLQLPISSFFWDTFPFFASVQFTSRLMNLGVVFAAPLIAGLTYAPTGATRLKWQATGFGLIAFGLLLYACFYNLTYAYWPASFDGTISQKALTEQIANGDVIWLPKNLADPAEVSRFRPPAFNDNRPASSDTNKLSWKITGADSYQLTASVSRPASVTVPLFWFEGWWKITNQQGRAYTSTPAPLTRLVTFDLPSGEYQIIIKLQDTPVRLLGNWLSIITFGLLSGFGVSRVINRLRVNSAKITIKPKQNS